jgi:diguanylate cyclase (GGDEF)-like protein
MENLSVRSDQKKTDLPKVVSGDVQPLIRPIQWTITIFLVFGLILSFRVPAEEGQRWALRFLIVLFGLYWYYMAKYVLPRYWLRTWVVYPNVIITSATIAIIDYLIPQIDLSPLYVVLIIVTAMLWTQRAALFAAALASILTLVVDMTGGLVSSTESGMLLALAVYFVSAWFVSQLSDALTKRWQTAAAEAEQQRVQVARRNEELEGLYGISQAFGKLEDAEALLRQVTERIARLLNTDICVIALLNTQNDQLQGLAPGYGVSDENLASFKTPMLSYAARRQWDIVKNDSFFVNAVAELPSPLGEFASARNIRQFVSAKMVVRGRITGMIFAANRTDGSPFGERDAHLLRILAAQAAVAVEDARLYQEAQANLRDLSRLYAMSAQFATQPDPDKIPQRVVEGIADALNAPAATIALLNESTGLLEYTATIGVPKEALAIPFRENGVGMNVLHSGEPRFIEDAQTAREVSPVIRVWAYRAAACLPIQRGGTGWGVVYVNYSEPHKFTPVEKETLAIFANQVAIALENAKLLRAEQRRSVELGVLASLSRALAETMDLEEMFRVVEQQVRAKMPAADAGALLIYDPQSDSLVTRASFGYDREIMQMLQLQPGESVSGKVFQSNQPMLFSGPDATRDARRTMRPDNRALFAAASPWSGTSQSVIGAPLFVGGEKLGVLILDNYKSPHAFSQEDLQFLGAMADRVALAIRNAQLYARERRRASHLELVNDLGHHITAILDIDELAQTLVRLIRDKFGYRFVHLFVNDPAAQSTILKAGIGPTAMPLVPGQFTLQFDQGLVGWTAAHGQTILANDVSREPRFQEHPAIPGTRAEMVVPLVVGAHVIGALDIQSEEPNAFELDDAKTLETLASQIAIALDNARLYGEVQEQARHDSLTLVFNHGYFIERLNEEIDQAQRECKLLSLIMLDVDFFKEYNDQYGHLIGDRVLSKIVQSIRAHVKHTDLVGRWGGEEFCIALLDTDTASATAVAQRIRQTLASTKLLKKDDTPIPPPTISQGIATFPLHARDGATLIDTADAALYHVKSQGRDQIHTANEGN